MGGAPWCWVGVHEEWAVLGEELGETSGNVVVGGMNGIVWMFLENS